MAILSVESFRFMADLQGNNSKLWFDENRKRYEEHVQKPLKALAESLSGPVSSILPEFSGKAKVSRINNDIRFSPNKPLYKQHMWVSFGGVVGTGCADLFVGISGEGWSAGSGIGAPKREPLDQWRETLVAHSGIWEKYHKALNETFGLTIYAENSYSKPLYPSAPASIQPLLQAREAWLITTPNLVFAGDPAHDLYIALCAILPAHLFMIMPTALLLDRLSEMKASNKAPDKRIEQIWKTFQ